MYIAEPHIQTMSKYIAVPHIKAMSNYIAGPHIQSRGAEFPDQ